MTTADAARELGGVSSEFVRGEILAGRLGANTIKRPGKRTVYRITLEQLDHYRAAYWQPHVPRGTFSQ